MLPEHYGIINALLQTVLNNNRSPVIAEDLQVLIGQNKCKFKLKWWNTNMYPEAPLTKVSKRLPC